MNLFEESPSLSVSEAMQIAKGALESVQLKIVGEISEFNNKPGYKAVYFTIKDKSSSLPCMMWLNKFNASNTELQIGALVEVSGRFSLYAAKGRMSFVAETITIAGEGQLRLQVALIEKKLRLEGLMDDDRKKLIPVFPLRIGVVTSPRGAAVHDVLRTLRRRYPLADVALAGVPVEGPSAAQGLSEALLLLDNENLDAILLVRGGGSFEDLMPFNDEYLARTIASLKTPVVTGIGHEPDTTIADLVADKRASTPTAAAEAVTPDIAEITGQLSRKLNSLTWSLDKKIESSQSALERYMSRPVFRDPQMIYAPALLHLDAQYRALQMATNLKFETYTNQVALMASRLEDLSPLSILARGYSILSTEDSHVVGSLDQVDCGDDVIVRMSDGELDCKVLSKSYYKDAKHGKHQY